jgi:hypothetical protein
MFKLLISTFLFTLIFSCGNESSDVDSLISEIQPTTSSSLNITSVTPPLDSTYSENSTLDFQVSFNEAVLVSGAPCLNLIIGLNPRQACYIFGNGMKTLFFRYTVVAGDDDLDGLLLSGLIDLASGSIKNSTDIDANLNFINLAPSLSAVLINTSIAAPEKITIVNQSNLSEDRTEVSFNWNAPGDNGNTISYYSIRYRKQGAAQFSYLGENPTGTNTSLSSLDTDSTYEIQVAAFNNVMGPYSDSLTVSTIFNPASLGALVWYEAKDINANGVVDIDGTSIESLKDKSGNSNHANKISGTSATIETVDGKKVIRMTSSGYRTISSLGETTNTDVEVYIIAKTREVTSSFAFVNENQANGDRYGTHFPWSNGNAYIDLTMENRMSGPWGGNTTDFFAWTFRSSTTEGKALERNGVEILNAGNKSNTAALKKWSIGSNYAGSGNFWKADMQAMFVFDKVLSASQRADFFAYIESEYGVAMQ